MFHYKYKGSSAVDSNKASTYIYYESHIRSIRSLPQGLSRFHLDS